MAKKKDADNTPKSMGKKASNIPSMTERVHAYRDELNKLMKGRGHVMAASDYRLPFLYRRYPTGLLSLDIALRGGFPGGGLSQICGPKNSGKTWIGWQLIRQLQYYIGENMRVLLAMTEMRADRSQAWLSGVKIECNDKDIQELIKARKVSRPDQPYTKEELENMKEQIGTIDELHTESAETLFDGILSAVSANVYHLIIIDSFGSIMSAAEAESESLEEKQYGGSSAVNTKFLRKLNALLTLNDQFGSAREVCIIGINQIRDNIGNQWQPLKSPGGRALEHAKFVDLWVYSGRQEKEPRPTMTPKGMENVQTVVRKEVNWSIEKGKAGIHEGAKGSYMYSFDINNADFYGDTIYTAVNLGIIEKAAGWLTLPNPNDPDKILLKANGQAAFTALLEKDAHEKAEAGDPNSFMNYLRAEAYRRAGIEISYEWEF
jgi:RecA/RadA recombinase